MRIEEPHSRVHKVTLIIRESFLWQILFARVNGSAILSLRNFYPCMTSGQLTTSWSRYVQIRGVHRVGYKRSTRPDKIFNKPEHDPIPERRKPDDPNPTRQ